MFPCSYCGLCCQNIAKIKELESFNLGNGICKHFNLISNNCNIYDDRPEICRIDKMFEIKYNKYFTKEQFYRENAKVCNALQEQYEMSENYRIKIGE